MQPSGPTVPGVPPSHHSSILQTSLFACTAPRSHKNFEAGESQQSGAQPSAVPRRQSLCHVSAWRLLGFERWLNMSSLGGLGSGRALRRRGPSASWKAEAPGPKPRSQSERESDKEATAAEQWWNSQPRR